MNTRQSDIGTAITTFCDQHPQADLSFIARQVESVFNESDSAAVCIMVDSEGEKLCLADFVGGIVVEIHPTVIVWDSTGTAPEPFRPDGRKYGGRPIVRSQPARGSYRTEASSDRFIECACSPGLRFPVGSSCPNCE